MRIDQFFFSSSNVLQYVLPAFVGLTDVVADLEKSNYQRALQKAITISMLILLQNRGTKLIKHIVQKPRPNYPNDLTSFPSGHMMIAVQSLVRKVYRDGLFSYSSIFVAIGTIFIGLGRYLPGKHDIVDLTAGAILGAILGHTWNKVVV